MYETDKMKACKAFIIFISVKFFLNGGWDPHWRGWSLWGYLMSLVKHRHIAKQTTEISLVSFYKKLSHLIRTMFDRFPRVVIIKCHRNLFYHNSGVQDQGVSKVAFFKASLLGLQMTVFFLSLCACLHSNAFISPSVRLDESPPIRPHFTLITSLKTLSQNAATFWGTRRFRTSTYEFVERKDNSGHNKHLNMRSNSRSEGQAPG